MGDTKAVRARGKGRARPQGGIGMKINNVTGAMGAYNQQSTRKVARGKEVARTEKSDGVSLSKEAQEVRNLKDKLAQAPDVRQDRIEGLRRQIADGTYRPSSREIAARMLGSRVFDDRA